VRQLAWHIQEKAFGGHDATTLRLLDAYGRQDADKVVLFGKLKPGTSVVREYQGVRQKELPTRKSLRRRAKESGNPAATASGIYGACHGSGDCRRGNASRHGHRPCQTYSFSMDERRPLKMPV